MLSICIPVYRYDVRPLVAELLRQAEDIVEKIEILVYDDASPADGDWGREELRQMQGIRYVELPENIGRAAIRNKMAREARKELVLMIDVDGWPHPKFLSEYINHVKAIRSTTLEATERFVIVGGRGYQESPPSEKGLYLHWWYGTEREANLKPRSRQHWLGFQSNNFLATRSILLESPFPEDIEGYGHEDTLWGQQLCRLPSEKRAWLYHLEIPVTHLGLEPNDGFLRKQKQAIQNLALLKRQSPHLRTRLIDLVERYPRLTSLAKHLPEDWLIDYLTRRKQPSLYALDLLKLKWWWEQ